MADWLDRSAAGEVGDPSRIHAEGMATRVALEQAREQVASWLDVRPRRVVFTSGATESIAMACFGARRRDGADSAMVAATVEHSAVRSWAARGRATEVGVDGLGRDDPGELVDAAGPGTSLVHLQWANHEVGTRQPVAEVAAACRERGLRLHVDAAQAIWQAPAAVATGAELVSISGHKAGGPAGSGVLVLGQGVRLPPLLVGGDQERARRAGLENAAAIVGLAAVASELERSGAAEAHRLAALTARAADAAAAIDGVSVLGHPTERAPHLLCLGLEGVEPQPVLLGLDQRGVAVHSGSSCSSEALEPSPVLAAMGVDAERSLRISVGWSTEEGELDAAMAALAEVLAGLRRLGGR
jgi:cysteine desulfurase